MRDGAYLLPQSDRSREVLEEQAGEIRSSGGLAHVLCLDGGSPEQNAELIALFDRIAEYAEVSFLRFTRTRSIVCWWRKPASNPKCDAARK